jgi:ubiquinone/menaquinone biosynthesis C-methylase UbiE
LDFGCGTGTLTILVKESGPAAIVTGIDIELVILNKAIYKTGKKKLDILFLNYEREKLPFQDSSFTRVIS